MKIKKSPIERVEDRCITDVNGCRVWQGAKDPNGYGRMSVTGKVAYVHRISWEAENGSIPEGYVVDHLCHNRVCVNPDHLRVVTIGQNNQNRKGASKASTSGIRGVSWDKRHGKWLAQVGHEGKLHCAGRYPDKRDAEIAAITLRLNLQENPSLADLHRAIQLGIITEADAEQKVFTGYETLSEMTRGDFELIA